MRLRRAIGRVLVELYPAGWRARYGDEARALIDDDPPGVRGVGSLLLGAADAHVRPQPCWSGSTSPRTRMRLSIVGVFACWIMLSLAGGGYQKETEEETFVTAAEHHLLLGIAHNTMLVAAIVGAAAIALGGLPLVWQAVRQARAQRDVRLAALLALAPVAVCVLLLLALLLKAVASGTQEGASVTPARVLYVLWLLLGLACATTCALTPRLVLARIVPSQRALRRATLATVPLAGAMVVVALALWAYTIELVTAEPALSGQSGGPIWPSTGLVLVFFSLVASACSVLALLGAVRARRAALATG